MAKILVVDDSKLFRMLASAPLVGAGHIVREVDPVSLFEVLKALYEFNPDLVVTDYWMPNCNGESLVRAIREDPNFHNVKILVCSSHGEESLVERMGQLLVNGYILKGGGMVNLLARAEHLVGES
jgi:two-component system chemotaxis response regulator CheY